MNSPTDSMIDVDDIRRVQDGVRVVLQVARRPQREAVIVVHDPARPGVAHVHPDRGCAWSPVEGEDQRSRALVLDPVPGVGDVEHLRGELSVLANREPAGLGRVADALAVDAPGVLCDDGLVRQEFRFRASLDRLT